MFRLIFREAVRLEFKNRVITSNVLHNMFSTNCPLKVRIMLCTMQADNLFVSIKSIHTLRTSPEDYRVNRVIDAIRDKNFKKARELIEDEEISVDAHNKNENTPLIDAASRGSNDEIKFLYSMGANLNASCDCPQHMTALHYATKNGHIETVKLLIKLGADVNALNTSKQTAIDICNKILITASLPSKKQLYEKIHYILQESNAKIGKEIAYTALPKTTNTK